MVAIIPQLADPVWCYPDQDAIDREAPFLAIVTEIQGEAPDPLDYYVRSIEPNVDEDRIYGPFAFGNYAAPLAGQIVLATEGQVADQDQKSDIIFPLTGYIGTGWAPDPGLPLQQNGGLRCNNPNRELILGQVQTRALQTRNAILFDVADIAADPMQLQVWNTTSGVMLASGVTDGSGLRKPYELTFADVDGEFVFSAVVVSGPSGGPGFFHVYGARLLEK